MIRLVLCACLALLTATGAQAAPAPPPPPVWPPVALGDAGGEVSRAELLLRIRQGITDDLQRTNLLRVRGRHLAREFEDATRAFDDLEAALASGPAPPSDEQWRRARDLLDILLHRRQSVEQQLAVLEHKRRSDESAAEFVATGRFEAEAPPAAATTTPAAPAAPADLPATPAATLVQEAADPAHPAAPAPPAVYDRRVAEAQRNLDRQQHALRAAEYTVRITEERVALNQDERVLVESGVLLARRHAELLEAEAAALAAEAEQQSATLDPGLVQARRQALEQRAQRALQAVQRDQQRIGELERRLDSLKQLRTTVQDRLRETERRYEDERRQLAFLQSPLAPHRVWHWLVQAVPRIALLLLLFAVAWLVGRWVARRVVEAAITRIRRGANEERLQRAQTLRRALRSLLTVLLSLALAMLVLPEFGVDPTVLLGSAAVLSLALAFGAQSLIKDYFSGFMILSENQYRIGNVVRINETAGVVEDISLRMTMLRDAEGIAHFIPHGEIRSVSNMTHGWAQALVDVRVGYDEDLDRVMEVLKSVAAEVRDDPEFGPLVLAEPELWGVEELGESAVVVRLVMRTRPLRQWMVKRELLRRIKNRFDQLGIVLPGPRLAVQQVPSVPAPRPGTASH